MPDIAPSLVTPTPLTEEQQLAFKNMLECAFTNIGIEVGKQIREVFQAQIKMNQDNLKNLQAVLGILDNSEAASVTPSSSTDNCDC